MSRKPNKVNALKEIQTWTAETVATVLRQNDLADCAAVIRNKGIDGKNFLELSEVKLNTWRRELGLNGIRALSQFITEINSKPQDYVTSIPDARLQTKPNYEISGFRSSSSNVGTKPKQNLPPIFQQPNTVTSNVTNSNQWGRPSIGSQQQNNEDNSRGVKPRLPRPEPSQQISPASGNNRWERPMLPTPTNVEESRSRLPPPVPKPLNTNIMNQLERQFGSQRNVEEKPRLPPPPEPSQNIPPRGTNINNHWNRPPANLDDTVSNTLSGYRNRLPPPPEPSQSENQWRQPLNTQPSTTDESGSRFRLPPPEAPQNIEPVNQGRVNEWIRQLNTQEIDDDSGFFPPPPEELQEEQQTSENNSMGYRPSLPLPNEQVLYMEENPSSSWDPTIKTPLRYPSNEDNESWATDWSGEHDVGEDFEDEQTESGAEGGSNLRNLAAMRNNYDDVNLIEEVDYMNSENDNQVNAVPLPGPKPRKPNTIVINRNETSPFSMNKLGSTEDKQQLPVPPGAESTGNLALLLKSLLEFPLPPKEEDIDYEFLDSTDELPPEFRAQFPGPPPFMLPAKPSHAKPLLPPPPSTMPSLPPPINFNERRIISQNNPPTLPPLPGRPPKVPIHPITDDEEEINDYEPFNVTMTSNKENSDEVDEYLIPITKGGIPSRPMIPISAPSRPSKPSIPMLPRKKSFDSTNTSIQTPSMPPHFNKQRTPPPKPNKLEPSLGGGSLSRSHRGVPPPSDHHLPPPRGNQSVVGLPAEPWFHKMDRRQADMALKGKAENGCFMIRPSRTTNPYTLSLIYDGQSYHIGVRQRPDGQFALGSEKYNEQKFPSVEALVENYRREHLVLYSHGDRTGCTRLTVTPSRNPSNL